MNDEEIWKSLKAGNKSALEVLFRRHHKQLYLYAVKFCGNKNLAEDQIQELFLKLWRQRENLGDVKAVKTYLWTALRRNLITAAQQEIPGMEISGEVYYLQFFISEEELIIEKEQHKRTKRLLEKAIRQLSPREKEALYLKFYEGMSYQEIEEIMTVNYQTARNYCHESLKKLRKLLINYSSSVPALFIFCNLFDQFCR